MINDYQQLTPHIQTLVSDYWALDLSELVKRLHHSAESTSHICEKQASATDWSQHDCICRLTKNLKERADEMIALTYLIAQKTNNQQESTLC